MPREIRVDQIGGFFEGQIKELVKASTFEWHRRVKEETPVGETGNLRNGWMPPHPTLFLSRNVYEKHGLFDISYLISADYDFILRVFSDSELKFGYYPFVVSKMRIGGVSNKSPKNIIKKSKEDLRAIRNNNTGNFLTLFYKNISKVKQFLFH